MFAETEVVVDISCYKNQLQVMFAARRMNQRFQVKGTVVSPNGMPGPLPCHTIGGGGMEAGGGVTKLEL